MFLGINCSKSSLILIMQDISLLSLTLVIWASSLYFPISLARDLSIWLTFSKKQLPSVTDFLSRLSAVQVSDFRSYLYCSLFVCLAGASCALLLLVCRLGKITDKNVTFARYGKHSPVGRLHFVHSLLQPHALQQNKRYSLPRGTKFPLRSNWTCSMSDHYQPPSSENFSSLPTYNLKPRLTQDPLKCLLEEILEYAFAENHACPLRVRKNVCHRKLNSLTNLL